MSQNFYESLKSVPRVMGIPQSISQRLTINFEMCNLNIYVSLLTGAWSTAW